MAKTNFSKVEDALNEGIRKMEMDHYIELAAMADRVGRSSSKIMNDLQTRRYLYALLKKEIQRCKDSSLFEAGGISREDLKTLLESFDKITEEEWMRLTAFKEKIVLYKNEQAAKLPVDKNEQLVEKERRKHINKRYNTKESWLPLH